MRESDIVVKIIREWERMEAKDKQSLGTLYVQKKYIKDEEEKSNSNCSSAHKTPAKPADKMYLMTTEKRKQSFSTFNSHSNGKKFEDEESEFNRYSEKISG